MNNYKDKRVIVIGGSGETGRRILSDLSHRFPDIRFSSAARREQRHLPSVDNIDAVKLDINDKDTSAAALADYDLAIIALGPMDKYGSIPHQACIAAGVDAIDINDNLEAADQILALHDQAHDHGRLILTGMGFVPGLSTLMLSQLARNKASPSGDYRCRIYMGAAYGGGETSPYAMLASFKRNVCSLIDGRRSLIPTPWKDEHSRFRFPSQSKSLDLIPFATPEIAGLSNHRCADELAINNLDSRYHVQFLSQGFAKLLSRFELSQKRADYFARKFFSGGQSVKTRKKADPDTTLIVYPDDRLDDGLIVHGVISSYDFTAQMACAAFDLWISNKLQGYQGVYPTELLDASSNQQLIDALASRGVTIRESTEQNFSEADIHFGWASQAPLAVEQLRNYGKNWYTIERPHPKMAG
ncbi:MAG: saccharopine dehydrogenase NADP-binding domain-containing protein, partial [Saccharospirillaceae bacterium]|nr:saccharopine dehydrogenase NADP-binding domain-containing protein [Saccharospirillaceae bacterium]